MIYAINEKTKEHQVCKNCDESNAGEVLPGVKTGETWRMVQADADGWIKWEGGECPLPYRHPVDIKQRDGSVGRNVPVGVFSSADFPDGYPMAGDWYCDNVAGDIIAYRPILEDSKCSDERPCIPCFTDDGPCKDEPEWDGVGLPPIGAVCEYRLSPLSPWYKCEVISLNRMVIHCPHLEDDEDNGLQIVHKTTSIEFRPILSDEDRAVDEIQRVVREATGAGCSGGMARALFRAGYRKTNTNEEK